MDNIIPGGGEAATLPGPHPGAIWRNNMIWQTAGLGTMPPAGVVALDPVHAPKVKENEAPRPNTMQPLTPDELRKLIRKR